VASRKSDVLILSSAIGSGHMRASAALTEGVKLLDPERVCLTVDFPREVSPVIERLLRTAYLESLKLWPAAYGRIYRSSASGPQDAYRYHLERAGLKALEHLISETGAKALVAPHFYGAGVLGNYKLQNPDAFAAVILTDYVPHPLGVPPNLNLYIVADEEAAKAVAQLGVPEERIQPTGIPIDPTFEESADVQGVRRDLLKFSTKNGEDDLPVVTVMGGGLGGGDLEGAVSLLLEASAAVHLVILYGSNTHSYRQLKRLAEKRGQRATFLAFTDRVRDLMAASAVLVTKPGGMSCTEALAVGLPQVLYHPIPGNEEDNAAAMVRYGAGILVESAGEVLGETLKILTSPNHRRQMVEAARTAHRPHSARTAARLILNGLP
jgi:processive 1,2-diacylglycerol beta-glucosyltransferase